MDQHTYAWKSSDSNWLQRNQNVFPCCWRKGRERELMVGLARWLTMLNIVYRSEGWHGMHYNQTRKLHRLSQNSHVFNITVACTIQNDHSLTVLCWQSLSDLSLADKTVFSFCRNDKTPHVMYKQYKSLIYIYLYTFLYIYMYFVGRSLLSSLVIFRSRLSCLLHAWYGRYNFLFFLQNYIRKKEMIFTPRITHL